MGFQDSYMFEAKPHHLIFPYMFVAPCSFSGRLMVRRGGLKSINSSRLVFFAYCFSFVGFFALVPSPSLGLRLLGMEIPVSPWQ